MCKLLTTIWRHLGSERREQKHCHKRLTRNGMMMTWMFGCFVAHHTATVLTTFRLCFFSACFPQISRRGCRDSNLKKKMKLFTKFDHIRALAHSNMERARLFWCWFGGRTMAIIIWVSFLISVHTHIRRRRFVRLAYNEATPKPFRPNVNLCVANAKRLHWNETWVCSGIASTTCRCVCPASRASTLRLRVLIIIIVYE